MAIGIFTQYIINHKMLKDSATLDILQFLSNM